VNAHLQGDDLQTLIPHERWAVEPVFAPDVAVDKMYVRFGGFLPGVDLFDAAAFRWVALQPCQLRKLHGDRLIDHDHTNADGYLHVEQKLTRIPWGHIGWQARR
jgi:hypothetical protein